MLFQDQQGCLNVPLRKNNGLYLPFPLSSQLYYMQFRSCVSSLIQIHTCSRILSNPITQRTHSSLKPMARSSLFARMGMPWDSSFCSHAIDRMRLHISSSDKSAVKYGKELSQPLSIQEGLRLPEPRENPPCLKNSLV